MKNPRQSTVLLVDDHVEVRQRLRALLGTDPQLKCVGEARNGREAVEMALRLRPNVVLMDIAMPLLNGLEASRQILAAWPASRIIILSAHNDQEFVDRAREIGAAGFIEKQTFADTLLRGIHEVALGRKLFEGVKLSKATGKRGKAREHGSEPQARREPVDHRESRLLQLVAERMPKRHVASSLHLTPAGVELLLDALMAKLGITSLANLAEYAIASGYVESDVILTIT